MMTGTCVSRGDLGVELLDERQPEVFDGRGRGFVGHVVEDDDCARALDLVRDVRVFVGDVPRRVDQDRRVVFEFVLYRQHDRVQHAWSLSLERVPWCARLCRTAACLRSRCSGG